ncbi:MAG: hypothetical protein DIU63_03165 [Proteobacteria bacterium]|jgi:Uncharacterized protein involved in exopolysaccharide biosynthesis|nr:MAG: hypothetical protein DIU63_03165 [Pseudomonadota bacterium]
MYPSSNTQAGLFGISFLLAVRRALPQLLLATIAAGLALYIFQSWGEPLHRAEVRLIVEADRPSAAAQTHIRALRDPIRLYGVANELGLKERGEHKDKDRGLSLWDLLSFNRFAPYAALQDQDERLLAAIYERLSVSAGKEKGEIVLRYTSTDPQLASKFVNRLAEVYLESQGQADGLTRSGNRGRLRLISWAEQAERADPPRKGPIAILGMVVTLLLGMGAIGIREAFRMMGRRRPFAGSSAPETSGASSTSGSFGTLNSTIAVAKRLLPLSGADRGCRTMVAAEAPGIDATEEAVALAHNLSAEGRTTILIRWRSKGGDIQGKPLPPGAKGLNDLLEGRATFEEIIVRLPGSRAHAIAAGTPLSDQNSALDIEILSLALDTLDEVYEHIVIVADHDEARRLFAALEGRFDACVSVGEAGRETSPLAASVDRFLGFDVTDIQIIRFERKTRTPRLKLPRPALQPRTA